MVWYDRRQGKPVLWITFWGTRGSIPTPERTKIHYGGNTSCVEVRTEHNDLIILDCGTGLRLLGKKLHKEFGDRPLQAPILLSHFHWDHIQGIPFFDPLYVKKNSFAFYAFSAPGQLLQKALESQMSPPFFPINMGIMEAHLVYKEVEAGTLSELIDGVSLEAGRLNHPQGCFGYRIRYKSKVLAYVTDHEPGVAEYDRTWKRLCRNADLVISDAQCLPEELVGSKKGWGHGSYEMSTRMALEVGVKHLVLFHHDPDRTDVELQEIEQRACAIFPETIIAAEGLSIVV
jgi:phosphoribosyl 1,2-cyclic phosphodiesterase